MLPAARTRSTSPSTACSMNCRWTSLTELASRRYLVRIPEARSGFGANASGRSDSKYQSKHGVFDELPLDLADRARIAPILGPNPGGSKRFRRECFRPLGLEVPVQARRVR